MFPIAISLSSQLNINILPYAIAVMFGASASFMTPIGYQTNLMVQSLGGYKFIDYLKVGLPLTILIGTVNIIFIPIL